MFNILNNKEASMGTRRPELCNIVPSCAFLAKRRADRPLVPDFVTENTGLILSAVLASGHPIALAGYWPVSAGPTW